MVVLLGLAALNIQVVDPGAVVKPGERRDLRAVGEGSE